MGGPNSLFSCLCLYSALSLKNTMLMSFGLLLLCCRYSQDLGSLALNFLHLYTLFSKGLLVFSRYLLNPYELTQCRNPRSLSTSSRQPEPHDGSM